MKIGFIGQGWIGKHYADDFEQRGYETVRYSLEPEFQSNKDEIATCDIVFIAVPTPTTPQGFDDHIVREAIVLVKKEAIAVIKSTIVPGTTESIQAEHPNIFVLHSPEFLVEKTAAYDAAHPQRNIIGIPVDTDTYKEKAKIVMEILPRAPYERIMPAHDAEFVKYAANSFLYMKVVFANMLYDLITAKGANWQNVRSGFASDPRIGESHTNPVDASGHTAEQGRGAGGHCFIKDFEVFRRMYTELLQDNEGEIFLNALKNKNLALLRNSKKDLDLVEQVYGKESAL